MISAALTKKNACMIIVILITTLQNQFRRTMHANASFLVFLAVVSAATFTAQTVSVVTFALSTGRGHESILLCFNVQTTVLLTTNIRV